MDCSIVTAKSLVYFPFYTLVPDIFFIVYLYKVKGRLCTFVDFFIWTLVKLSHFYESTLWEAIFHLLSVNCLSCKRIIVCLSLLYVFSQSYCGNLTILSLIYTLNSTVPLYIVKIVKSLLQQLKITEILWRKKKKILKKKFYKVTIAANIDTSNEPINSKCNAFLSLI